MVKENLRFAINKGKRDSIIADREKLFIEAGFSADFIQSYKKNNPTISQADDIKNKINGLLKLNFKNPVKLIEEAPRILSILIKENIEPKIEAFKKLGFSDLITLIEKAPNILNYSFKENIEPKIKDLTEAGFSDPIKMIEKMPSILGCSMKENIEPKIKLLKKVFEQFSLKADPIKTMEVNPVLLSLKIERLLILMRVLEGKTTNWQEITESQIGTLIMKSLDNVLVAYQEQAQPVTVKEFRNLILKVQKEKLSKEEKTKIILQIQNEKLLDAYKKAYMK